MLLPVLALGAAAFAAAAGPAPCLAKLADDPSRAPATLDDLSACQRRALDDLAAKYAAKHDGGLPSDALMTRWQKTQDAETQKFLAAHPDQAPPKNAGTGGVGVVRLDDVGSGDDNAPPPASSAVGDKGKQLQDEQDLSKQLLGTSADGKPVLSGDAAQQIGAYLQNKQGGTSPDMQRMMLDLQTSGRPSDQSVGALKQAAGATGDKVPDVEPPDPRQQ